MLRILPVPALKDNYIWIICSHDVAVVIDPGEAEPVRRALGAERLQLAAILITHHHWDHVNGVGELVERYDVPVYGPHAETIPRRTHALAEGAEIEPPGLGIRLRIFEVPGHTLGAIAYFGSGMLLSGDTLFTAGCGRLFEGTAAQMTGSLAKLKALPLETRIYCGHEYTLSNLAFAQAVEPDNEAISSRIAAARRLRAQGLPTVPGTVEMELKTNPFLRCEVEGVRRAAETRAHRPLAHAVDVFAVLRAWKDVF
jgi:hydroxyacylglutathione hydrolase